MTNEGSIPLVQTSLTSDSLIHCLVHEVSNSQVFIIYIYKIYI